MFNRLLSTIETQRALFATINVEGVETFIGAVQRASIPFLLIQAKILENNNFFNENVIFKFWAQLFPSSNSYYFIDLIISLKYFVLLV